MQLAMIQDAVMPLEDLPAPYLDRGMFFGDGVYEVLRSYKGKLFALDPHMQRFAQSLEAIDIRGIDLDRVRRHVIDAYAQSGISEAKVYFHATRGQSARDMTDTPGLKPSFFMTVTELEDYSQEKDQGISVWSHPDWRWKKCHIKSLNLLANVMARRDAHRRGCREAILFDEAKGLITEGAGSSFFALLPDAAGSLTLRTSPLIANILPSVTRTYVLRAADNIGLSVVEESVSCADAIQAQELFIAMTTHDIVPVVRFAETPIGDGKPGLVTQQLMSEFRQFVA